MNLLGARHISTTACYPCANGLVERFHRQLKATLTSSNVDNNQSWMDNLPLVMLSLQSQLKEDWQCSPADLVFSQPLVLPGQFLSRNSASQPSSTFVQYLQDRMSTLVFTPTHFQTKDIYVPTFLDKCDFVFIWQDSVKKPLTPSYSGSFWVLARHDKFYTIQLTSGRSNISIDRLKPAYIEQNIQPTQTLSSPAPLSSTQQISETPEHQITKKGGRVHWPSKFQHCDILKKMLSSLFSICGGV